jgi:replicative DNA helicase
MHLKEVRTLMLLFDPTALQNEAAEISVIGAILLDANIVEDLVDNLRPDHFCDVERQEIFRVILDLYRSKQAIDIVTIMPKLKGNKVLEQLGYEFQPSTYINGVATTSNAVRHAEIIVENANRRALMAALQHSMGIVASTADYFEIQTSVNNTILEAEQRPDIYNLTPDSDKLLNFLADVEKRKEFNKNGQFIGLDSGFHWLNEVTLGLQSGLWIIGARPSLGKTTFIKQLTDQVAMNNEDALCLFVSYEQSVFELLLKTFSRFSKINSRNIQKGRLTNAQMGELNEAMDKYNKHASRIFVLEADGANTTIDVIKSKARQLMRSRNTKKIFIAIDYLQLVPTSGFYKSDKERIDNVCSSLRRLARDLDSPVVVVSSLNRANYGKDKKQQADLDAFKESGGIEYSADIAMVMEEDHESTETLRNTDHKIIDLRIIKNRNGARGKVVFEFNMPHSTFTEKNKEELEEAADEIFR